MVQMMAAVLIMYRQVPTNCITWSWGEESAPLYSGGGACKPKRKPWWEI